MGEHPGAWRKKDADRGRIGPGWLRNQPAALVEPHRIHDHSGATGQLPIVCAIMPRPTSS